MYVLACWLVARFTEDQLIGMSHFKRYCRIPHYFNQPLQISLSLKLEAEI